MKSPLTEAPAGTVTEELVAQLPFALWRHPGWAESFPWLVQGTTDATTDFGLFGSQPCGEVLARWRSLDAIGGSTTIHSRQIHGAAVKEWTGSQPAGLILVDGYDGHLTAREGILLAVSVADCVPVFLVAPGDRRAVSIVHAGWRGVGAGILEAAIAALARFADCSPADLYLHFGPSICGRCYEVGPEVHEAVNPGADVPPGPHPIDLRSALVERAAAVGGDVSRITVSSHCTRCGSARFFSHRGGDAGRQLGLLGIAG